MIWPHPPMLCWLTTPVASSHAIAITLLLVHPDGLALGLIRPRTLAWSPPLPLPLLVSCAACSWVCAASLAVVSGPVAVVLLGAVAIIAITNITITCMARVAPKLHLPDRPDCFLSPPFVPAE